MKVKTFFLLMLRLASTILCSIENKNKQRTAAETKDEVGIKRELHDEVRKKNLARILKRNKKNKKKKNKKKSEKKKKKKNKNKKPTKDKKKKDKKNQSSCEMSDPNACGCDEVQQSDYRGTISRTKSGIECQRWDSQVPHEHEETSNNYPKSGLIENYCRNPDEGRTAWCYTMDPNKEWEYCDVPICGYTPQKCLEGESLLEVVVDTDCCPEESSWDLIDTELSQLVWSNDSYDTPDKVYRHSTCVDSDKTYSFIFNDDGYFNGYYEVEVNGKVIKHVNKREVTSQETILCSKDEDCDDSNKCSTDTCNYEAKECQHTYPDENCQCLEDESLVVVEVETDPYPHDSSWDLRDIESDQVIWSNGLYDTPWKVYRHSICLENSKDYLFTFYDDGYFIGYYKLIVNDEVIKQFEGGDIKSQDTMVIL